MLVDWDLDAEWTPERAAVARTLAWWYLRRHATEEFSAEIAAGVEYWMPDEAGQLSVDERGQFLALWLAGGLARTRLYYLEPAAGDLAIQAGGDVRTGRLPVSDPPAPFGLLVSPGGLGYTADGMQLIAAAWQPIPAKGRAVSWFIDSRDWFDFLVERKSITLDDPARAIRKYGFLRYVHTTWQDTLPDDTAQQLLDEGTERIVPDPGGGLNPGIAAHGATATLSGAWTLTTHKMINLDRLAPPPDVADQDREFGIAPSKITRGWIDTTDPARLWEYTTGPETGSVP